MTVEYRSDLNGGLERGFWLREFCVMAKDPDPDEGEDEKVMLVYGCLGDYPQYVSAYSEGRIDTRRFPICIVIGEGANVVIDFSPEAFMTAEDVQEYCVTVILPNLLEEMRRMVSEHNLSDEAHPALRNAFSNMDSSNTLFIRQKSSGFRSQFEKFRRRKMKDPMMGEPTMREFMKNIDLAIEHFQDMVRLGEARIPKDSMLTANSLALRALKDLKYGITLSNGRMFIIPDETEILEKYADKPIPTKEIHDIARAISLAKNINLENRMLRGMADEYVRLMAQKICQDQAPEIPND